jgi:hypothetical protein
MTEPLLFLGDSHVHAFRVAKLMGLLGPRECAFLDIAGATAAGLANDLSATGARTRFLAALAENPDAGVILHLGEVDCGFVIWWRAQTHGTDVARQREASVAAYLAFVDEVLAMGRRRLLLAGTVLPTIRQGTDYGEVATLRREVRASLAERTRLTLEFNQAVREGAMARRLPYCDITGAILDPETGTIRDEFRHPIPHDHHLHPQRAAAAWAACLRQALARR